MLLRCFAQAADEANGHQASAEKGVGSGLRNGGGGFRIRARVAVGGGWRNGRHNRRANDGRWGAFRDIRRRSGCGSWEVTLDSVLGRDLLSDRFAVNGSDRGQGIVLRTQDFGSESGFADTEFEAGAGGKDSGHNEKRKNKFHKIRSPLVWLRALLLSASRLA